MFKQIVKTLMKPFGNWFAYGIMLLSLPASKMTSFFNKTSCFAEILLSLQFWVSSGGMNYV